MKPFLQKLLWFYLVLLILSIASAFLPFSTGITITDKIYTFISAATLTGSGMSGNLYGLDFISQIFVLIIIQLAALWQLIFVLLFAVFASQQSLLSNNEEYITFNRIVKKATVYLILFEAFSAIIIYAFSGNLEIENAVNRIFSAIFHGISIFTASGFTLIPQGFANNTFAEAYIFQVVLAGIMLISSLGYFIHFDLTNLPRLRQRMLNPEINWKKHSRFNISALAILIIGGSLFFYLSEKNNVLSESKIVESGISAIVNICGFNSFGISTFQPLFLQSSTLILLCFVMLSGVAGGSVCGGLTIAVWAFAFAAFKIKNTYKPLLKSALAILVFSALCILIISVLIKISLPDQTFKNIIFEAISAFTNTGHSIGIYDNSNTAKILLVILMLSGRFGIMAIAFFAYIRFSKNASAINKNNEIALI